MSTETVSALENQLSELRARVAQLESANRRADRLSMVVFPDRWTVSSQRLRWPLPLLPAEWKS